MSSRHPPQQQHLPRSVEICQKTQPKGTQLAPGLDTIAKAGRSAEVRMDITTVGTHATRRGPADWFTGTVWQDPVIEAPAPARVRSARVSFEPGARTAWHTHPLGQTLYVLTGVGRAQTSGGPVREIRPGDTVWIPPGEKHWHGAAPTTGMAHLAIQESLDGTVVTWLEHVSDADYAVEPAK